jgi:2-amino-4-hydroxy-6-hydroxymethyldihydropteridine diphosphokinase
VISSRPLGPSLRTYANAVALVECSLDPPELLERLHAIEAAFGRCRRGQAWRERVLDLDIALWEHGFWADGSLVVPHRCFRERRFVLGPAAEVAPGWRDPLSGLTLRQLAARLG